MFMLIAVIIAIVAMVCCLVAVAAAVREIGPALGLFAAVTAAFIGSTLIVVRFAMYAADSVGTVAV